MDRRIYPIVTAQTTLLFIEWFSRYDTDPRRIALMLTNSAATAGILILMIVAQRRGQRISTAAICVALLAIWADASGNFGHQYGNNWWFDHLTHATGGLGVTAIGIEIYRLMVAGGRAVMNASQVTWAGLAFGQALGALYEVSEYLGDQVFATHRVGAGYDTSRDLTFNLLGGVIAAILFFPYLKRQLRSK